MANETERCLLYITASSLAEARRVARAAVDARVAACANILPGMKSVYHWEGAIAEGDEVVVLLKTRSDLVGAATEVVVANHSFDCPCVVALPIAAGHAPFLNWIGEETQAPAAN